jgi:dolichol-phosphate mannosyltransferase
MITSSTTRDEAVPSDQSQPDQADPAASGRPRPSVSIIVPTYKEALNIPHLVERIDQVRMQHGLIVELLLMDDSSKDGTEDAVASLGKDWVRLIVRTQDRGLSPAVVDGLRAARHDVFIVMDADLSHPPEKIPELLDALANGADFVIGSRYIAGGSTDNEWGVFRWLNSKVATLLARPFTNARDPMAGFFALRRATFERGERALNPIGYKIGLELLVKCGCRNVSEVPIHFVDRKLGASKMSFKEQLKYLQHLRRLFIFRYWTLAHFTQFLAVGLSGTVVNLLILTLLILLSVPENLAVAGGIAVSVISNFALNRRFTFSYARSQSVLRQFAGFVGACSVGMVVNYLVTVWISPYVHPIQLAAAAGILAGMVFNFLCTRYVIFRFTTANPEYYRSGA